MSRGGLNWFAAFVFGPVKLCNHHNAGPAYLDTQQRLGANMSSNKKHQHKNQLTYLYTYCIPVVLSAQAHIVTLHTFATCGSQAAPELSPHRPPPNTLVIAPCHSH
jgi:hypothetical protein